MIRKFVLIDNDNNNDNNSNDRYSSIWYKEQGKEGKEGRKDGRL